MKNPPAMWEKRAQLPGQQHLLEEKMATHSSVLAWRIPWRGEPGRDCKESDRTESLSTNTHNSYLIKFHEYQ